MNKTKINEPEIAIKEKICELVTQMTLEEKVSLCSGKDFWRLKAIERLGLSTIMVADGPHGLRKQLESDDNLGIGDSVPAVCFPTASALACSFDKNLVYEVGKALGEECLQEEVSVILGPGANQKRSPLCGRNFEYFSEDPLLTGEMAASMIQGVQSQGIGTSLKHFAVNNQEKRRMTVNAVVDERALRETYLKGFEIAVKKGKPWTVMCAYNRLNGTYCSENPYLFTHILREEWGFEGLVVSDWGAVNNRVLGIKSGEDLEMPGSNGINDVKIMEAVKNGELLESDLDKAVCRITELILKSLQAKKSNYKYDVEEHHNLAIRAAEESAVLLKNEDRILPGNLGQKALIIGGFAKKPRYQGAGSSKIHSIKIDNAWESLISLGLDVQYQKGYSMDDDVIEETLIAEACEASQGKDIVYLFAGLPDGFESEGFDRTNLSLPNNQNRLIEEVTKVNPNVVVILSGGAPMELPWIDQVKGIMLTYLDGEGCGTAVANLLLGNAVPCGKLAETWPLHIADTPSYHYFPGGRSTVEYRESIFVGYRYYEAAKKQVLYPFGYGLSYTSFSYSNLKINKIDKAKESNNKEVQNEEKVVIKNDIQIKEMAFNKKEEQLEHVTNKHNFQYGEEYSITFDITNTGTITAKEIALIFVSHQNEKVFMPVKELKGFEKVTLQPGETKQVKVILDTNSFAYYNTAIHDWYAESGEYTIWVGSSSFECRLHGKIHLSCPEKLQPDLRQLTPTYYNLSAETFEVTENEFSTLYGNQLPPSNSPASRPYDANNTIMDVSHTFLGKVLIRVVNHIAKKSSNGSKDQETMMSAMIKEMPFHSMVTSGGGMISQNMLEVILHLLNRHCLRACKVMLKLFPHWKR